MLTEITLPETNSSHLKLGGWKTSFLLGCPIFRGYVSFREGKVDWFYSESSVVRLCDWIHPESAGSRWWQKIKLPILGVGRYTSSLFREMSVPSNFFRGFRGTLFRTKLNLHSSLLVHLASHILNLFVPFRTSFFSRFQGNLQRR